jgi:hypothetical protein
MQANYLAADHRLPLVLAYMQEDPYGVGHWSESGPACRIGSFNQTVKGVG